MSEDRTCRLCLSTEGSMEEIFASPQAELPKKIFDCTSVEVKNLAGLPASICEICKSELIIWLKFRRQCLSSNEILKAKFPALFAEPHIETEQSDDVAGQKRHGFVDELSECEEDSRQDDPDYREEPEYDEEDVPLLRFKVERSQDYETEELQTQDDSLEVTERTIRMEIEPQQANEKNTGKRRMTRNSSDETPRLKRKSSGRGEAFVLLDRIDGSSDMKLPENRKESDRFRFDPKPPDGLGNSDGSHKVSDTSEQSCNCNAKLVQMLKDFHQANNEMFQHLTEEIVNLRREVLSMRSSGDNFQQSLLPLVPFENIDDFLKFELEIQEDQDKFNELENTLSQQRKYSEPVKFVKEGIKIFFEDKLAEQFTWRGTSEKRNVRDLNCTMALRHAFRRRYPNANEEVFDRTAMKHFQYAKDRTMKKLRYNKLDADKFLKCPKKSKSPSEVVESELN